MNESQYRLRYRAMLDRLSAVGLYRNFGESREKFADRVNTTIPSLKPMTNTHLSLALGGNVPNTGQQQKWNELDRAVRKEVNTSTVTWRKVIAFFNPFSWLLTK